MDPLSHAMSDHAIATARSQYGLITLGQAFDAGMSKNDVRRVLRAEEWRRVFPRVYAVRPFFDVEAPDRRLRSRVMAAQLVLGPEACAGAETAAHLWGIRGLPRWTGGPIHMVLPGRLRRSIPGGVLHRWDIDPGEVATIEGGIRVTDPCRTLRDVVLRVDRDTAICLMDSGLNQRFIGQKDIEALEAANRGRRGCAQVRRWWSLADGRAESPLETRVRLICVDGGLPPTTLQRPFHDGSGRLIGVVDFWWEELRVIGEADGIGPHSEPAVLARDRSRQNALQAWHPDTRIVRFTWKDLQRPKYILAAIARAGGAC